MALAPKDWLKLIVSIVLHPRVTWRWLRFVEQDPLLSRVADARLLSKVTRPYVDARLRPGQRLQLLMTHYAWVHRSGLEALVFASQLRPVSVCRWEGRHGEAFEVMLTSVLDGHREGEISLTLTMEGSTLYTLTGLVTVAEDGKPVFLVGRLQGRASDRALDQIRLATKALEGARPNSVLVSAAIAWARAVGCSAVDLVCNADRIALNPWRRRRILADNERLWAEMGACWVDSKGLWRLIAQEPRTIELQAIPSRKRAQARRRQDMLGTIDVAIQAWVVQVGVSH